MVTVAGIGIIVPIPTAGFATAAAAAAADLQTRKASQRVLGAGVAAADVDVGHVDGGVAHAVAGVVGLLRGR